MLSNLNHPNIIKMHSTFQDNKKLYFVLEYCPNKDLSDLIKSSGRLNLETTKFYSAQIILALEYMHSKGIYHRDLKPENILLDENLNLKLCDFATANIKGMYFDQEVMKFKNIEEIKQLEYDSNNHTNQEKDFEDLIGTAEYVSPEVLSCGDIGPAVDLWALGCIIFTALHGRTPFKEITNFLTFNKILSNKYSMEENLEEDAKDIINKLLILDPIKRLGCGDNDSENDFKALKHHNFFKSIDWDKINIAAPFSKLEQNGVSNHLLSPIKRSSDHLKKSNLSVSSNSSADNSILSSISFDDFSPFKVKLLNINDKNNGNILFQCNIFIN
jgi:3-phosphoinositide dependent protein kinase-1